MAIPARATLRAAGLPCTRDLRSAGPYLRIHSPRAGVVAAMWLILLVFGFVLAAPGLTVAQERPRPATGAGEPGDTALAEPPAAEGQGREEDATAAGRESGQCPNGVISYVFIDNHSIFDTSDPELDKRFAWAYRAANALHARTRQHVIRRELLFKPGDCYDPLLLDESARLLRNYDFLSHVDIFAVPHPDGTYHVIVDTQDEWTTQVTLGVKWGGGPRFQGLGLRETNLFGTGRSLGFFYRERDVTRDYGITYATPQLLGTRWDLEVAAGRTRAGTFVGQSVAYPFVGEVGRWAARQGFRRDDQFFDYIVGSDPELHVLAPVRDKSFNIALLTRRGVPGNQTLLGAALDRQELTYPGGEDGIQQVVGDDFDDRHAADPALKAQVLRQREDLNNLRLLFLLGRRKIRWVTRRGFDSMRGQEDIGLGTELGFALGPSLPALSRDDDIFAALTFRHTAERGPALFSARLHTDGRHDLDAVTGESGWRDIFSEGELLAYLRPGGSKRQVLVFRAAGAGGWNTRTPFQLTLGGDDGVRGYRPEEFPGGRRVLFTLEDRFYLGSPRDMLDLGGTVFFDVGRIWPGDAPFGVDSGWKAAAGIGLRGAFPAGSRTTYRLDVAFPLRDGLRWRDARLIFSVGEPRGVTAGFGDPQLLRSRRVDVAREIFHFPD